MSRVHDTVSSLNHTSAVFRLWKIDHCHQQHAESCAFVGRTSLPPYKLTSDLRYRFVLSTESFATVNQICPSDNMKHRPFKRFPRSRQSFGINFHLCKKGLCHFCRTKLFPLAVSKTRRILSTSVSFLSPFAYQADVDYLKLWNEILVIWNAFKNDSWFK